MIVAKCYPVVGSLQLEISCVHLGDAAASHLIMRETRTAVEDLIADQLRALADTLELASLLPNLCAED